VSAAADMHTTAPDPEVAQLRAELAALRARVSVEDLAPPPAAAPLPRERRELPPPQMTDRIRAWREAVFGPEG
jgi:anti-sigma factor RsiW